MNPFHLHDLQHRTRRTFLAQGGLGLGSRHCGSSLMYHAANAAVNLPENPLAPRKAPLPAKAKAVIYLHMPARRRSSTCSTTSRSSIELNMQPCPDVALQGRAVRLHQGHAEDARHAVQVQAARPERHVGERAAAALRRASSTTSRSCSSMYTDQFNHAPAELFLHTGRTSRRRRVDGLVGHLRPRHREPGSARLRRARSAAAPTRPAARACGAAASCPRVYQGVQCRTQRRADPLRRTIPRA